MTQNNKIILFEEQQIRRVWHQEKWWYVLEDVVQVLTNSVNPKSYIRDMRRRDKELGKGWGQIALLLTVETKGGKQKMNCADTEGVLRVVMSISSPKAEPFKLWLARVGYEHIEEIENPELAIERVREIYKAKGYSDDWIDTRIKSIETRKELTDEWKERGVKEGQEYAILTAEIAKATFGLSPTEHKELKNLEKENLRDHMTKLELIFTMLGEEATRRIAIQDDAQNYIENHEAAQKGGRAAGGARENFEKLSNQKVVSPENFLGLKKSDNTPEITEGVGE